MKTILALMLSITAFSGTASARGTADRPEGTNFVSECNLFDNDGLGWGAAVIYQDHNTTTQTLKVLGISFSMIVFDIEIEDQSITDEENLLSVTSKKNPGSLNATLDFKNKVANIAEGRTAGTSYKIHSCQSYNVTR